MGRNKKDAHIPHQLWNISCELEGISILLQNQGLSSQESIHFAEGIDGLGQIIGRSANRLRKLSRVVDELEVSFAVMETKEKKIKRNRPSS